MVPTFVTAHSLYLSRDGPRNSDFLKLEPTKVFSLGYDYAGSADLDKGCRNPKKWE